MFEGLAHAVLGFVEQYGYVAVFVYMVLETAFILHFAPSEVVVPFAASQLVHDPVSFVLFVVDTTAGATTGSLLAYVLFGTYGREVLERYGHVIHVSERSLERSDAIFTRYGESSVFWGRMLPLVRALISIPAGLAEMDFKRFLVYSAGGALLFNTVLTYLVYTGSGTSSPLGIVLDALRAEAAEKIGYVEAHTGFVVVVVALALLLVAVIWAGRGWIRSNPARAKLVALHGTRLVGLLVSGLFVLGALTSPERTIRSVTAVWDDPLFFVDLGFSDQLALLLTGLLIGFGGLVVYELGELVEIAHVRSYLDRLETRIRR